MRLFFTLVLMLCFYCGFAQSATKKQLLKEFAESSRNPNSANGIWFCKDEGNFDTRDSIVFHNSDNYSYQLYRKVKACQLIAWVFLSETHLRQSTHFICMEPPEISVDIDRHDIKHFAIEDGEGTTKLQVVSYNCRTNWFKISRTQAYDSASKVAYPVMTLVRLKK